MPDRSLAVLVAVKATIGVEGGCDADADADVDVDDGGGGAAFAGPIVEGEAEEVAGLTPIPKGEEEAMKAPVEDGWYLVLASGA